jgi:hypothetical protein
MDLQQQLLLLILQNCRQFGVEWLGRLLTICHLLKNYDKYLVGEVIQTYLLWCGMKTGKIK